MIKNKIHIFYRHYNITGTELRRPQWFNYEKCFLRLLETIKDNDKVILHIVYDNKIQGYNWINKYKDNFKFIEFEGGSDWASFIKVGSILEAYNIQESDLIYILENDYIHVDGWVDKVFELFNTFSNLNYVSLYDHKDKYFLRPCYNRVV